MISCILKHEIIIFATASITPSTILAKTIRIGVRGELKLLDPHTLNETFSIGLLGNTYEGLIRRDQTLKIIPGLAKSWQTLSPMHWRFHLRKGVRFQNGERFSADDVIFSMRRARGPSSQMKARIPTEARFIRVDAHTVDVLLSKPDPTLHYGWDNLYILSKSWADAHGLTWPPPARTTPPH